VIICWNEVLTLAYRAIHPAVKPLRSAGLCQQALGSTIVYGQPDLTTATGNNGDLSASSLPGLYGLVLDASDNPLHCRSSECSRALLPPREHDGNARLMVSRTWHPTHRTMEASLPPAFGSIRARFGCKCQFFAVDWGNNRVLVYP